MEGNSSVLKICMGEKQECKFTPGRMLCVTCVPYTGPELEVDAYVPTEEEKKKYAFCYKCSLPVVDKEKTLHPGMYVDTSLFYPHSKGQYMGHIFECPCLAKRRYYHSVQVWKSHFKDIAMSAEDIPSVPSTPSKGNSVPPSPLFGPSILGEATRDNSAIVSMTHAGVVSQDFVDLGEDKKKKSQKRLKFTERYLRILSSADNDSMGGIDVKLPILEKPTCMICHKSRKDTVPLKCTIHTICRMCFPEAARAIYDSIPEFAKGIENPTLPEYIYHENITHVIKAPVKRSGIRQFDTFCCIECDTEMWTAHYIGVSYCQRYTKECENVDVTIEEVTEKRDKLVAKAKETEEKIKQLKESSVPPSHVEKLSSVLEDTERRIKNKDKELSSLKKSKGVFDNTHKFEEEISLLFSKYNKKVMEERSGLQTFLNVRIGEEMPLCMKCGATSDSEPEMMRMNLSYMSQEGEFKHDKIVLLHCGHLVCVSCLLCANVEAKLPVLQGRKQAYACPSCNRTVSMASSTRDLLLLNN